MDKEGLFVASGRWKAVIEGKFELISRYRRERREKPLQRSRGEERSGPG